MNSGLSSLLLLPLFVSLPHRGSREKIKGGSIMWFFAELIKEVLVGHVESSPLTVFFFSWFCWQAAVLILAVPFVFLKGQEEWKGLAGGASCLPLLPVVGILLLSAMEDVAYSGNFVLTMSRLAASLDYLVASLMPLLLPLMFVLVFLINWLNGWWKSNSEKT